MIRPTAVVLLVLASAPMLEAREVKGALAYRERIALPEGAEMVVEARDAGGAVVELRRATAGQQVPLDFVIEAPETAQILRAAVFAGARPIWVSEPVAVPQGADADLGVIALARPIPMGFAAPMRCGDLVVDLGFLDAGARLRIGAETFVLAPDIAASGARYADGKSSETAVHTKGNRALVTLRGQTLPECAPMLEPDLLPLTVRGNEPGWVLTLTRDGIRLSTEGGDSLEVPLPEAEAVGEATRFAWADGDLTLEPAVCRDSMTGMPYPLWATLTRGESVLSGCGGDPARLLAGLWRVGVIDGAALSEAVEVTLEIADNRVSGRAGCNRYAGSLALTGEGMGFGPAAATKMACAPELMQAEAAFLAALARVTGFDIAPDGALILLAGGDAVLRARR
ncbi:META domain-containing protein [Paracoccaceae bacterium Fryx2]|nr:META domain-containing protein [Paracoccaceae bacterium Fryx2]